MEPKVSVRCALCGKDIPIDGERYSIEGDDVCMDCAEIMTLADIFNSEKVGGVSWFDGKIWYNPFISPDCDSDSMVKYDGDVPVVEGELAE